VHDADRPVLDEADADGGAAEIDANAHGER
jgi:hypothetical protein